MDVLVIGGNGYVGASLVKYLKKNEIPTYSFGKQYDDYNNLTPEFLQSFTHIILLAGHSSVKMCAGPLKSPWSNNVRNFENLIKKTNKHTHIIYASSSSVYGQDNLTCYNENQLNLNYVNNYDLTKMALDLLAIRYIHQDRKIIGLRFGTVNGPSPVIRKELMLNSMVYNALNSGSITITNKKISRPILATADLNRAVYTILTHHTWFSDIYNLASFNSTVEEMAIAVKNKINRPIDDRGDTDGVYNFSIDCSNFVTMYNFDFVQTPESIVKDLIVCYSNPSTKIVTRDLYFNYET